MHAQDTANHIFINRDAESQGDLLGNSGGAPVRIPPFHFDNGADEFFLRPLWARPKSTLRREQHAVLALPQQLWKYSRVEGFNPIAEPTRRAGRMNRAHKPVMIRSAARSLGARLRPRFKISS